MNKISLKSKRFEDCLENTYFKASQHYFKLTSELGKEKKANKYILLKNPEDVSTSFGEQLSRLLQSLNIKPSSIDKKFDHINGLTIFLTPKEAEAIKHKEQVKALKKTEDSNTHRPYL